MGSTRGRCRTGGKGSVPTPGLGSTAPYVVYWVATVATKREESAWTVRCDVAANSLHDRHEDGRGDQPDPLLVDEGQGLWSVTVDQSSGETECKEHGRERCASLNDHYLAGRQLQCVPLILYFFV